MVSGDHPAGGKTMGHTKPNIEDMVGAYPICPHCQKASVVRDAWAKWSRMTGEWVLKSLFNQFACDSCGETGEPIWKIDQEFRTKRIRRLNDEMRIGNFKYGVVVMTSGVQALSDEWRAAIVNGVSLFGNFSEDNDPHGEHDFGSIKVEGEKFFWKIDYFDLEMKMHSPDAADPDVTYRVLTIMFAHEY
jgi:hypothetical protein